MAPEITRRERIAVADDAATRRGAVTTVVLHGQRRAALDRRRLGNHGPSARPRRAAGAARTARTARTARAPRALAAGSAAGARAALTAVVVGFAIDSVATRRERERNREQT